MNSFRSLSSKILIGVLCVSILAGCSPARQATTQPANQPTNPTEAINEIRKSLDLPELSVEFVENTTMGNSPSQRLEVANYRDSEGRVYSVDPKTNQVVEIDARAILSNIPANAPSLPAGEIKAKALAYAKAVVPGFDSLQSSLRYDEGGKIDNYFFSWYDETGSGPMHPFLQFAFHKSGVLFAYYNTLSIEE